MMSKRNLLLAVLSTAILIGCGVASLQLTPTVDLSVAKLSELRGGEEKAPKPEHPDEAAAYWAKLLHTPAGTTPAGLNQAAKRQIETRRAAEGGGGLLNVDIQEWGPGNFGGRLRGLVIDPNDSDTIVIGSVSGGIWKTTDGGATWTPSNDFLPSLAVGSMIVDPDDDNRIWVGTGEGFFNVDAAQGIGILRSDDFGETWALLPATNNANFNYVNRMGRVPGTNVLLAATRAGIFRSTDLGVSWGEVSGVTTSGRGFTDLQVDPSTPSRLYAYHYGGADASRRLYVSTDSGASWTALSGLSGLPTTNISRMEIGIGGDGVVYMAVSNTANTTRGLYRMDPSASPSFLKTASNTAFIERQGWYDLPIGVDPSNSDRVYMGAVDMYRTADAGATITKQTFWNPGAGQTPQFVHADLHVITFDPIDPMTVYIGCDGGIFKSLDGGTTWIDLNNNLRITQYYGIAAHPDGVRVTGGTQDNGSHVFFGDNAFWLQWFGGDGGYSGWDQQDPNFIYGATPFAGLFGSPDQGSSSAAINVPNTAGSLFITPFLLDPNDGNRMMVGTNRVYYSENIRSLGGASFADDSGAIGTISALAFDPHDADTAWAGRSAGQLSSTSTLGAGGWAAVTVPWSGAAVTGITVDTHDVTGNTVYVTLANYATNRVWKTSNGGASWTSIHGDLPNIPMFSVVVDPLDAGRLFLGSEMGLFTTDDNVVEGGFSWDQYEYGMAYTRVQQLVWADEGNVLWAGTHGRSIYRIVRAPGAVEIGPIDDALACDPDGFLDDGELASVSVTITNNGGIDMTGISATMSSADGSLSFPSGSIVFDDLVPGAADTEVFEVQRAFVAACLTEATLDVDVTHDQGMYTMSETITLGADAVVQTGTFSDGAEGATVMTHEAAVGNDDWAQVSTQANSGAMSWFASDMPSYEDKSLLSPWFDVGGGSTDLTFSLFYNMEGNATQYWDGAVLELRTEGGAWFDIGNLSTVPYDGPLFGNNTIGIRDAWSGVQTAWRDATVALGSAYNGQRVQFRFRVVNDTGAANVGFWVDDIAMTNVTWIEELLCDELTCEGLFADDFETGDATMWDVEVP